jgi:hypothetical protein
LGNGRADDRPATERVTRVEARVCGQLGNGPLARSWTACRIPVRPFVYW